MTSKLFENSTPQINTENTIYFKPFLNFGYDKNIGFALTRYCSTLSHEDDLEKLQFINKNIPNLKQSEIFFNSYVFVLTLNNENTTTNYNPPRHYNFHVLFGGIDEYYEEKIPIPITCAVGELRALKKNENAIIFYIKTNEEEKLLILLGFHFHNNWDHQ
jgi:hypothetical protein